MKFNASLPIVHNEDQSMFIQERLNSSSWLDMYKNSPAGGWFWTGSPSPLTFTKWYPGEPVNDTDRQCAVVNNTGIRTGWKTESCSNCENFMCQKRKFHSFIFFVS